MNKNIFSHYKTSVLCMLATSSMLVGCSVDEFVESQKDKVTPTFDFSTQQEAYLNINYGDYGKDIVFNVYTESPSANEEAQPVFSAFADANGHYEGELQLPTSVKKVWVHTEAWGLPNEVEVEKVGSDIVCDLSDMMNAPKTMRSPATRAGGDSNYQVVTLVDANGNTSTGVTSNMSQMKNLYSIVKWWDFEGNPYQHGQIFDFNHLVDDNLDENITPEQITDVQYRLWQGVSKPATLDNSALAQYEHINTKIKSGTQLHVTFVDENGFYESAIGYYYYRTGETVKSLDDTKKYIIYPNASKGANAPFGIAGDDGAKYDSFEAPLVPRTRIKLLFEDENGNVSDLFPEGYTIGFFILPDGFCNNGGKLNAYQSHSGTSILTTDPQMYNQASTNLRFMSLQMGDRIFYGVEDGNSDKSFDDILWTVDASTPNAIVDDGRKPVSDLNKIVDVTTNSVTTTTYAFEDVWPDGGDYDLNDVIVQRTRTITVGRATGDTKDKMRKVVDDYYVVTPDDAANDASAFVILYDKNYVPEYADPKAKLSIEFSRYNDRLRSMSFPVECEEYDDGNGNMAYILFEDGRYEGGWHYVVEREWKGNFHDSWYVNNSTEAKGLARPFIITRYGTESTKATGYNEIHLPGDKVTCRAKNRDQNSTAHYYIGKLGKYYYPYAIEIPRANFTPSPERMNIGDFYPRFNSWAESQGKTDADWYNNNQ